MRGVVWNPSRSGWSHGSAFGKPRRCSMIPSTDGATMASMIYSIHHARARLAALTRHHGADSYYTRQARRDLRFVQLAREITDAMDAEPPLTLEQVRELRTLLNRR